MLLILKRKLRSCKVFVRDPIEDGKKWINSFLNIVLSSKAYWLKYFMVIRSNKGELDIRNTHRDANDSVGIDEIVKSRTSINF